MAATAYAAAVSLLNTIDQIKIHPFLSTYFNQYSIESLREMVDFFVDFLEKYSDGESEEAEDLVRRIGDVAHDTEETINVEAAHRIRSKFTTKTLIMLHELKKITKEMDCIKEKAISFMNPDAEDLVRPMAAVALEAEDIFIFSPGSTEKSRRKSRKLQRKKRVLDSKKEKAVYFMNPYSSSSAPPPDAEDLVRLMEAVALEPEDIFEFKAADEIRSGSSMPPSSSSSAPPPDAEDLVRPMAAVSLDPEDIFEFKAADEIRSGSSMPPSSSSSAPPPDAEDLVRPMAAVSLDPEDIFEFKAADQIRSGSSMPPSSSSAPPATDMTTPMVGFDGYLAQLLDKLTGHVSDRQTLPIVGMAGIGKTTLATNVYENLFTVRHFDVRAWITVSQQFSARDLLLQALSCLRGSTSNTDTSDDQLGVELSKILYGRRYLVVLDDVWSVEAWDKIMRFFPENNNGSRIIVTTRESELVDCFGSSAVVVDFLDEKNSWELFCKKTFAEESCPPELEEIGKEIVEKCKGLPLAITVFGGLLRKSPRTREYWEIIAKDKSSILDSGEGDIKPLSILYSSYKHLPVWLKPCFLCLGLYPEDYEINVSQLIKLWVAEGCIRSKTEQSLEEIAESYTKELVDRNLLLVGGLTLNKKLKSCRVHDVVRELCMRIGEKEKYFCVQRDINGMRHFIVDEPTEKMFHHRESPSILHPLILEGQRAAQSKTRLLRVLFYNEINYTHVDNSSQLVNLRFLFARGHAVSSEYRLDLSIQLLWSLQTLILHCYEESFDASCEIWKMPQLRHINISFSISLPDPPSPTCEDDIIILKNLQSLKRVNNLVLTEEVCKRIPNIKELGISYEFDEKISCYHLHNLGCFNKLESLNLGSWNFLWDPDGDLFKKLKLPSSLKELKLKGYGLVWSDHHMAMIASLPHLQILKFDDVTFIESEWDCVEGGFLCLKHLEIDSWYGLIKWSADSSSFPVLETLSLKHLSELEEIPLGIGEIPTLERMYVEYCSESASMSAVKILEEQESDGNDSLQLTLGFQNIDDVDMFREEIQQLGITCQNLHIHSFWTYS